MAKAKKKKKSKSKAKKRHVKAATKRKISRKLKGRKFTKQHRAKLSRAGKKSIKRRKRRKDGTLRNPFYDKKGRRRRNSGAFTRGHLKGSVRIRKHRHHARPRPNPSTSHGGGLAKRLGHVEHKVTALEHRTDQHAKSIKSIQHKVAAIDKIRHSVGLPSLPAAGGMSAKERRAAETFKRQIAAVAIGRREAAQERAAEIELAARRNPSKRRGRRRGRR